MKVTYKNVVYKISYKAFGRTRIVTSKNFELRKDAENEAKLLRRGGQTDVHVIRINKTLWRVVENYDETPKRRQGSYSLICEVRYAHLHNPLAQVAARLEAQRSAAQLDEKRRNGLSRREPISSEKTNTEGTVTVPERINTVGQPPNTMVRVDWCWWSQKPYHV